MTEGSWRLQGALGDGVFPQLLREIYVGRKSGLLHFKRGTERRSVRFAKGRIVHGDTSVREAHLGQTMVGHGLLSPHDFYRASAIVDRTGKRIGLVLQELGIIDRRQLEEALTIHVTQILETILGWTEGAYAFEEQREEPPSEYEITLKLSTAEIIVEAVRRVRSPEVMRPTLGDMERILILSTDPLLRFQRVALTTVHGFLLSRVDGTLSAREILDMMPVPAEEAQKSLFGLLCIGMVEFLPVRKVAEASSNEGLRGAILSAYHGLKTWNHFEALGVTPSASEDEIKTAYLLLAKAFHPDLQHAPAFADLGDKIEAVFLRVTAAYNVLGRSETRAAYEEQLARRSTGATGTTAEREESPGPIMGEEVLESAVASLAQQKPWEAEALLLETLPGASGRLRRRARGLLAQIYLRDPRRMMDAREQLQAAIHEDPDDAEAYHSLGLLYKQQGLIGPASAMFRKVLQLNSRHRDARSELDGLSSEPQGRTKRLPAS